jgi:hypothetical protein
LKYNLLVVTYCEMIEYLSNSREGTQGYSHLSPFPVIYPWIYIQPAQTKPGRPPREENF